MPFHAAELLLQEVSDCGSTPMVHPQPLAPVGQQGGSGWEEWARQGEEQGRDKGKGTINTCPMIHLNLH